MATAHEAIEAAGRPSDADFHYAADGIDVTVPSVSKLDPTVEASAAFEDAPSLGNMIKMVRSGLDETTSAAVAKMRISQFKEFVLAWGEHSGVTLGE